MPITWQNILDPRRFTLAPPLAWAIAAAAIMSVFAVIAIIVNYVPLNSDAEARVRNELTPATFESVGSLIKASGNACPRVCSVSAVTSLAATASLDVTCALDERAQSCSVPIHYRVSVEATSVPQR